MAQTTTTTTALKSPESLIRERPRVGRFALAMRRLRRSPVGLIGAVIVVAVVIAAIFAPALAPHNPTRLQLGRRFLPPVWMEGGSWAYWLGTDQLGRDIWSRILYGSQISVFVGVASSIFSGIIGVLIGLVAGFYGKLVDSFLSRVVDTFLAIPFIVLALAVAGVLGPGLLNLIIVLTVTGWVTYARVVRGEVLAVKERDYIMAARVIGQQNWKIALSHILPNVAASVIVLTTLNVATTIIAESSLSFLGLGVDSRTVTWGSMLADGREHIATSWWMATFPGLAITITVLGIIFVGDWLRDVLDPKMKE
ncbi:MAG: ABC transporter permease [Chloroflexaceae bacterium]|jgi:peptide/nickel transport system permease protein|nr:ABC transporter permease [Chloroflexaceae bacterium]